MFPFFAPFFAFFSAAFAAFASSLSSFFDLTRCFTATSCAVCSFAFTNFENNAAASFSSANEKPETPLSVSNV